MSFQLLKLPTEIRWAIWDAALEEFDVTNLRCASREIDQEVRSRIRFPDAVSQIDIFTGGGRDRRELCFRVRWPATGNRVRSVSFCTSSARSDLLQHLWAVNTADTVALHMLPPPPGLHTVKACKMLDAEMNMIIHVLRAIKHVNPKLDIRFRDFPDSPTHDTAFWTRQIPWPTNTVINQLGDFYGYEYGLASCWLLDDIFQDCSIELDSWPTDAQSMWSTDALTLKVGLDPKNTAPCASRLSAAVVAASIRQTRMPQGMPRTQLLVWHLATSQIGRLKFIVRAWRSRMNAVGDTYAPTPAPASASQGPPAHPVAVP